MTIWVLTNPERKQIKKENSCMGNALKTYKRIYIIIDVHNITKWSQAR